MLTNKYRKINEVRISSLAVKANKKFGEEKHIYMVPK